MPAVKLKGNVTTSSRLVYMSVMRMHVRSKQQVGINYVIKYSTTEVRDDEFMELFIFTLLFIKRRWNACDRVTEILLLPRGLKWNALRQITYCE